ncbi:MAG: hypothetical protein QNK33_00135, partial [Bacteroidales bacterium]|nr:hypothetical protein [Bacteroidales bacterium]
VNEDKNLLYWTDYGRKGKILVTDLNSGDQLEPIVLPYDTHLSYHGLNIIDDNTLLCLNEKYSELDVMFFYLDIDGKLLGSRAQDKLKRTGVFGERSAFLKKNPSSGKYNYMGDSDTLYVIEDTSLVPVFLLESDDRFNNEDNLEGTLPGIKMQGSKYSLLSNDIIIVSNTDAGSSIMPGKTETLIMDNKNHKLERINKLLIDYLAFKTKNISFTFTNNYAVYSFEAIKLLKISEEALLQKDLEPVVRERMKKLAESISENDNPYLLIGKIK